MSDVTKCTGTGCLVRARCWRYLAPATSRWQNTVSPPDDKIESMGDDGRLATTCPMFWEVPIDDVR